MSNMTLQQLEEKMIDLEIRLTHQDDHIQSLDKIIYEQDQLISAIASKLKQLDHKLKTSGEANILSPQKTGHRRIIKATY